MKEVFFTKDEQFFTVILSTMKGPEQRKRFRLISFAIIARYLINSRASCGWNITSHSHSCEKAEN